MNNVHAAILVGSLISGCTHVAASKMDETLLNEAIQALDSPDDSCASSKASTQDRATLDVVRSRQFHIEQMLRSKDQQGDYVHYTLRSDSSRPWIVARIWVKDGGCRVYEFGFVVE